MGYLVTAHVLREQADFDRLRNLPPSIGARVYFHTTARLYLIDTFRSSKKPAYPFQTQLPAADISLDLPPSRQDLASVYTFLLRGKKANGFKTSYANFCCTLSALFGQPVLSLIADDDEHDLACTAAAGELVRFTCRCEDVVTLFDGQKTQVSGLAPEEDVDEGLLTDLTPLKAIPGVEVLPSRKPWDGQLHSIALEELATFAGTEMPILGLGSFDPPEDVADWQLVRDV